MEHVLQKMPKPWNTRLRSMVDSQRSAAFTLSAGKAFAKIAKSVEHGTNNLIPRKYLKQGGLRAQSQRFMPETASERMHSSYGVKTIFPSALFSMISWCASGASASGKALRTMGFRKPSFKPLKMAECISSRWGWLALKSDMP